MANENAVSFPRGIHPREGKEFSEKRSIEILPAPKELRISLSQHIGAPTVPCVQPREALTYGQKIGEAKGFVSSAIFAPLPGTMKRMGSVTLPNGRRVPAIIETVEAEGFDAAELFNRMKNLREFTLDEFTSEEILEKIMNAGLVGQGGAAFPTHVKLSRNKEKPVDALLINGCECEPYLTADHRLMLETPDSVIAGAQFAAKALGATQISLCVETNKPDAIQKLADALRRWNDRKEANAADIQIQPMKTKYPQGGEKQLIYAALRRKVPLGKLPMDIGAAVVNVGTAVSIAMATLFDAPLTHRVVTVTGGGINRPANLFVPIGTPISLLIEHCGGLKENARRVLLGGPMMGFAVGSLDVPVTKGTSGITVFSSDEVDRAKETNCIRCGRCVSACPMRLIPSRLMLASRAKNWDAFREYHPTACIECGCCSFSCPAKIPIIQLIRVGKMELARQKAEASKAKALEEEKNKEEKKQNA